MASKKDSLFNSLAILFIIFSFVGFLTLIFVFLETYNVKNEIALLNGEGLRNDLDSEKERLITRLQKLNAEYSNLQSATRSKAVLGFKEKYADSYAQIHGEYPNFPEYIENGAPKAYSRLNAENVEIQDSGLLKYIERLRTSRQDESDEADKYFRISKEEVIKHPIIIQEQNKNIIRKIEDINKLDQRIFTIKLEYDDEIKKMRDDFAKMDNEINVKVDEHLKKMSKKNIILVEMKNRLDILKRKNFTLETYEEFLKLSREELELEAQKEHLKNTKNLDQEQLAEAVFQSRSVDGAITNVSGDRKTIIINIGNKQGVKMGQTFEVFELKNGTTKIVYGKIVVKEVKKFSSICSPVIEDKVIPLFVPNYYVGDFDFTPYQKAEFVLVGEFKGQYTEDELSFMIKKKESTVEKNIGYSTNFLVLGEKPEGDYPPDEIAEQMKDEGLYYKKSISEIMSQFGYNRKVSEYVVLFESAKEMGVKILDETKLLDYLDDK